MSENDLISILESSVLKQRCLSGQVALVTGGGGGIGYQTARALLWLGASVIIAEINRATGKHAEIILAEEFGKPRVKFIPTDVGNQSSVQRLTRKSLKHFNKIDILINNAAIAPLGLVVDTPIATWDASYRVNLRGPLMLIQNFLPPMLERNAGTIINVSSTGTAYMGAYETFKSAIVHLTETLDAELTDTGVTALTLGPGLVPTATATNAIKELSPELGLSLDDFYKMNQDAMLSVEEAGAGFGAAVVFAEKFRGQEISARQALNTAGYQSKVPDSIQTGRTLTQEKRRSALHLAESVYETFQEQTDAWQERSIFERQWMLRDFRKNAGRPVDEWRDRLALLIDRLREDKSIPSVPLQDLAAYYQHLAGLAEGYAKDPKTLKENLKHINRWRQDVEQLMTLLDG